MSKCVYNWLGRSGLKVSNICLGTLTFGQHPGNRPYTKLDESFKMLDMYTEWGGNFIDTADSYQHGDSEKIIGKWLENKDRNKYVVASKFRRIWDPNNPNCMGASRRHIMWSIDQTLERLGTDYLDIYYLHIWDAGVPLEESLQAMNDLVSNGKVRYIGLSNLKGWQLQKAAELTRQRNWHPIVALQQQYNLLCRSTEWEVAEVCRNEGIALLPWSPLKGGWLSGNIDKDTLKPKRGSRIDWASSGEGRASNSHPDASWFKEDTQRALKVIEKCEEISKAKGKSVPQVAIRWLLEKENVPSVVIGARTLKHLEDNYNSGNGWNLSIEEIKELDDVSSIRAPYPYDYVELENRDRIR